MQKLIRARKNEKGFTLVELMVVVIIIGVLVAIVIPVYGQVTKQAANKAHDANVRTLHGAALMLYAEKGDTAATTYTETAPGALGAYIEKWPDVPERADAGWTNYKVTIETGGAVKVENDVPAGG